MLISDEVPEVYFNADRMLHMARAESLANMIRAPSRCNAIEEAAVYA